MRKSKDVKKRESNAGKGISTYDLDGIIISPLNWITIVNGPNNKIIYCLKSTLSSETNGLK